MLPVRDQPESDDGGARHLAGLRSATHNPLFLLGLIVAGGFALRLPLAFVHGYSADIGGSIELARNIVLKGLPHAYAPSLANPDLGIYPPAYYYVLGLLGAIYQRFFHPPLTALLRSKSCSSWFLSWATVSSRLFCIAWCAGYRALEQRSGLRQFSF